MTTADAVHIAQSLARVRPVRLSAYYAQWERDRTALIACLASRINAFDAQKFIAITLLDNPQDAPSHFRRARNELTRDVTREELRHALGELNQEPENQG